MNTIVWLNVDKFDFDEIDDYLSLSSFGLSNVVPAFITLIKTKLSIGEVLDTLSMDSAEA